MRTARRGSPGRTLRGGLAATALATAAALLGGLVSAAPAAADEPGDNPANPYERTLRISLGAQPRKDRCQAGQAVHYGGPDLKALAAAKLTGTDAALRDFVRPDALLGEWYQAANRDRDTGTAALRSFQDRQAKLNDSNKPYRNVNSSAGRDFWAPEFGADIVGFTVGTQAEMYAMGKEDPTPRPGQAAWDKAREVFAAFDPGDDAWAKAYKDTAGRALFNTENLAAYGRPCPTPRHRPSTSPRSPPGTPWPWRTAWPAWGTQ